MIEVIGGFPVEVLLSGGFGDDDNIEWQPLFV